jgi:hypothetical protein
MLWQSETQSLLHVPRHSLIKKRIGSSSIGKQPREPYILIADRFNVNRAIYWLKGDTGTGSGSPLLVAI